MLQNQIGFQKQDAHYVVQKEANQNWVDLLFVQGYVTVVKKQICLSEVPQQPQNSQQPISASSN